MGTETSQPSVTSSVTNSPLSAGLTSSPFAVNLGLLAGEAPAKPVRPHLIEHPVAQHALAALRDQGTNARDLRVRSSQLLSVLALAATADMPVRDLAIESFSGPLTCKELGKPVVFLALASHALGLAYNIADLLPNVVIGSISLDRLPNSPRLSPRLHLSNAPALHESRILLFAPLIATGISAGIALNFLRKTGVTDMALLTFVASATALSSIQSTNPELSVWTCAIDEIHDPKRGPLPGVGNFGERLYASEA